REPASRRPGLGRALRGDPRHAALPERRGPGRLQQYHARLARTAQTRELMSDPPAVPELQTPQLLLRRLVDSDAPGLHAAYGDPARMRFWDSLPSRDLAETAARVRQSLEISPQWYAAFAVLLRDGGEFVGMVNYHRRVPPQRRLAVGWILARPWWGQGLAEEATRALLDHCFTSLDAHR